LRAVWPGEGRLHEGGLFKSVSLPRVCAVQIIRKTALQKMHLPTKPKHCVGRILDICLRNGYPMFRSLPILTLICAASAMATTPARASDFVPVAEKQAFVDLVQGRDLRLSLFDITLRILPDGQIKGDALGWGITGTWSWQDGYFCREMDWSGEIIDFNCQLVEAKDASVVRFTVDKGQGKSASFNLR
jgi:hypothetical protein